MRILSIALPVVFVSMLFMGCGSDGSSPGSSSGGTPSCAEVCPGVLSAHCPAGPADEADCENGCQAIRGKCGSQYSALYECAPSKPTYTCGSAIGVIVAGCEDKSSALSDCFTGP
jgi:hypothetical protein